MKQYPPIVLEHLETLTDRTGVIQHSIYSIPNRRTGYTSDDNARALIVAVQEYGRTRDRSVLRMVSTYLSFLHYAQTPSKHFHNFMSFDQVFLDNQASEDCFGRVLWACGEALAADIHENIRKVAKSLFDDALRWIPTLASTRGWAYSILGCYYYLQSELDSELVKSRMTWMADSLCACFHKNATNDWTWFEPFLTYSNGIPPRALLLAHKALGKDEYLEVGLKSLDFLNKMTNVDDIHQPIGCNGWYFKDGERAWFDQQPVDPMSNVMANIAAYEVTGNPEYFLHSKVAFDWYFGGNCRNEPLYDPVTGGCFDGLEPDGPNLNQGSESTICCLLAQLAMAPYTAILTGEASLTDGISDVVKTL